jgi:SecD/SecF fusion protein
MLGSNITRDQFVKKHIVSSQKVGPAVAEDIKVAAIWAIVLAVLGIALYIFLRFPSYKFSIGALVSLIHDVVVVQSRETMLVGLTTHTALQLLRLV